MSNWWRDDEDLSDVDPWAPVDEIGWIEEGEEVKKEVKKEERVKEEDQDSMSLKFVLLILAPSA